MATYNGKKAVASAGTAECLVAAPTAALSVTVQAKSGNAGTVVAGGVGVVASAGANRNGIALAANQSATFQPIADLNEIWLDVTNSGDAVSFVYQT